MLGAQAVADVSHKNLFMTVKEADLILRSVTPAEKKYRLLLLLVAHGCRPCEAVRLHVNDFVKADCTEFYATNTKVAYNNRPPRRDLKVVPSWVGTEIRQYIEETYQYGQLRGGFLFPSSVQAGYRHMTPESLLTWFGKLRKRLGLNEVVGHKKSGIHDKGIRQYRVSVYSFRRLFATELAFNGGDQRVIATLMGHKDTSITAAYQDKARLLMLAPETVAKMPRFFQAGQTRIDEYLTPRIEVRQELVAPSAPQLVATVQGTEVQQTEESAIIPKQEVWARRAKGRCSVCGGSLRHSRLSGKVFCKECWTYEPTISH